MKKIKLESLKIKSFVTRIKPKDSETIKGGESEAICLTCGVAPNSCDPKPDPKTIAPPNSIIACTLYEACSKGDGCH